MITSKNSIVKQMQYIILLALYDEDNQKKGMTLDNFIVNLADNKKRWFEVGKVSDEKNFPAFIEVNLSSLAKEGILERKKARTYMPGQNFEEGLIQIITELNECLEVEIELNEWQWNWQENKEKVIELIENDSLGYLNLKEHNEKKMCFLNEYQVKRLMQLSIKYEIYE